MLLPKNLRREIIKMGAIGNNSLRSISQLTIVLGVIISAFYIPSSEAFSVQDAMELFEQKALFCNADSPVCLDSMSNTFNCLCEPEFFCVGSFGYFGAAVCQPSWTSDDVVFVQGDPNEIYHAWWAQNHWDRFPMKKAAFP
ncbi:uncharacterized protein LOC142342087 [Convolutriloba macropyga]|uniref:uncharacterized protein LOC142342087 n=1 Tax=Convolutriloba macropyga TaxID=536237 RepID=UPI003F521067